MGSKLGLVLTDLLILFNVFYCFGWPPLPHNFITPRMPRLNFLFNPWNSNATFCPKIHRKLHGPSNLQIVIFATKLVWGYHMRSTGKNYKMLSTFPPQSCSHELMGGCFSAYHSCQIDDIFTRVKTLFKFNARKVTKRCTI